MAREAGAPCSRPGSGLRGIFHGTCTPAAEATCSNVGGRVPPTALRLISSELTVQRLGKQKHLGAAFAELQAEETQMGAQFRNPPPRFTEKPGERSQFA